VKKNIIAIAFFSLIYSLSHSQSAPTSSTSHVTKYVVSDSAYKIETAFQKSNLTFLASSIRDSSYAQSQFYKKARFNSFTIMSENLHKKKSAKK